LDFVLVLMMMMLERQKQKFAVDMLEDLFVMMMLNFDLYELKMFS
jgi:hypothetical protein